MTKPKHPPHRLGHDLAGKHVQFDGKPIPLSHLVRQNEDDLRDYARWIYLHTLSCVSATVLEELGTISEDDESALLNWQIKHGLKSDDPRDDWCIAYARSTIRFWRRYPNEPRAWCDRDDRSGELVPANARSRRRQAKRPRVSPAHFVWLARFQLGATYSDISKARSAHVRSLDSSGSWAWPNSSRDRVSTIRQACIALGKRLRLRMRETALGRPRKPR
jgi:hypothetical protein